MVGAYANTVSSRLATLAGEKSAFLYRLPNPPASLHLFCCLIIALSGGGRWHASLAIPSGRGLQQEHLTAVDQDKLMSRLLRAHSGLMSFYEELDNIRARRGREVGS